LVGFAETDGLIQMGGGLEGAESPQKNGSKLTFAAKLQGIFQEGAPETSAAARRMNQEPAQLRFPVLLPHNADGTNDFPFHLRNPQAIFPGAKGLNKLGQSGSDVPFERVIQPIFLGIAKAMKIGDVTYISRFKVGTNVDWLPVCWRFFHGLN